MILNGKTFVVNTTDTYKSVVDRIASLYNTIPKYLKFTPEVTLLKDFTGYISVYNILDEILQQDTLTFPDSLKKKILSNYPELSLDKIEQLFIVYNSQLEGIHPSIISPVFLVMKGFISPPEETWDNREVIKNDLDEEIELIKDNVRQREIISDKLKITSSITYSEFVEEKILFTVNFGSINFTLEEIFNNIYCSEFIPYIVLGDIYKIKKKFNPDLSWTENKSDSATIYFKVDNERPEKLRKIKDVYKKYSDCYLGFVSDTFYGTFNLMLGKRNITKTEFLNGILDAFPLLRLNISGSENVSVMGNYIYPLQTVDLTVFSELAMNDSFFNEVIVIDESVRASKIKQNLYLHILHTGETVSLQMKIVEKFGEFSNLVPGDAYIRARIPKAENLSAVYNIQILVGKLFSFYNDNYKRVVKFYKKFIPSFSPTPLTIEGKKKTKEMTLRNIAPDIFVSNYSRKCIKTNIPYDYKR